MTCAATPAPPGCGRGAQLHGAAQRRTRSRFNATFSLAFPPPGRLAFVTQSGGLGLAALTLLTGPSLGVSGFVSVGNTADLTAGPAPASLSEAGIPAFTYPEQAAAALGQIARWAEWQARPAGHVVTPPGIDPRHGREVTRRVLARQAGGGWADAEAAGELLAAYGIAAARPRVVRTPAQAAAAQAELGGLVAVKIAAAIHKSDVGGLALGIDSPQAAADAVTAIRATLTAAGIAEHAAEFLIQEQIRDGVEMIVGVSHDPAFGPLVLAGLGGTTVEVLGDVAVRITPLSSHLAARPHVPPVSRLAGKGRSVRSDRCDGADRGRHYQRRYFQPADLPWRPTARSLSSRWR